MFRLCSDIIINTTSFSENIRMRPFPIPFPIIIHTPHALLNQSFSSLIFLDTWSYHPLFLITYLPLAVILDLPLDVCADTGGFELIYRQAVPESQPYLGPCLFAFGKQMTLHEPPVRRRASATAERGKSYRAWTAPPTIERLREPKVVDFIAYLNNAASCCAQDNDGEEAR